MADRILSGPARLLVGGEDRMSLAADALAALGDVAAADALRASIGAVNINHFHTFLLVPL